MNYVRDQRRGITIHRGLYGDRRIVTERNGRRVVSMGPHRGYLEHAYLRRNGRQYIQRTYYVRGVRYATVYRTYYYGGRPYYGYVPGYYYRPVFYRWAYNPWARPVYYRWGWYGDPWYGYYGSYFTPYPVYPTASSWLTDYLLAENLKLAYEAQHEPGVTAAYLSPGASGGMTRLSPQVKQAIAEQVKQQLAAEQAAAPQGAAANSLQLASGKDQALPALDPAVRVFVVPSNLNVATADGQECELTPGDVLLRTGDSLVDGNKVGVSVQSSKKGNCAVGTNAQVEVSDLQEMHNRFREQVDAGLKTLAENQGKGGLPPAPDTQTTQGEVPPPPPDQNVDSELQLQQKEAEQTETQVQQETKGGG